jgi:hypothetical protein
MDRNILMMQVGMWSRIKKEIHILICTNDKKYADVRKQLRVESGATQTIVVTSISLAVATQIGVAAAAIVPLVAVALYAAARLGTEAYCGGSEE